ncbi:hypothetical protein DFH11DRAFT_109759 [Phellopilus nigrolimitatus]|nr:hypothetical protein DFH11DRAFT_109759 [Phellopilus nigrolimitatus]
MESRSRLHSQQTKNMLDDLPEHPRDAAISNSRVRMNRQRTRRKHGVNARSSRRCHGALCSGVLSTHATHNVREQCRRRGQQGGVLGGRTAARSKVKVFFYFWLSSKMRNGVRSPQTEALSIPPHIPVAQHARVSGPELLRRRQRGLVDVYNLSAAPTTTSRGREMDGMRTGGAQRGSASRQAQARCMRANAPTLEAMRNV